jgi:two-component system cell cycle response regulator CpdR
MDNISVLLVEDGLTDAGYAVTVVTSGDQALAALSSKDAPFSAVVTDIRLGIGPDGWAVVKRAREIIPSVPESI